MTTQILDDGTAKGPSLTIPSRLGVASNVTVSDISINVIENGDYVTAKPKSHVHRELKSELSVSFRDKLLSIRPDDVVPTEKAYCADASDAVLIRMGDSGPSAVKAMTIHTLIADAVLNYPDVTALGYKDGEVWVEISYREYFDSIIRTARGFLKLGLEPGHSVGILGFNCVEWFLSYMGAIYCAGLAVGIYTTNTAESCQFVAEDCRANIIVVENTTQLNKILAIRHQLPHLKAIVQYKGDVEQKDPMVYSWADMLEGGETVADQLVLDRLEMMAPNKCCALIYTSGTTGKPKGVMISHDNITWTAGRVCEDSNAGPATEVTISYLPLSHVAAQLLDLIVPLHVYATVYFAQPDALKGSLAATLKDIRPTIFFAVPRVWEKLMEKMVAIGSHVGIVKKHIGVWAKGIGLRGNKSVMNGGAHPWGWTLANYLLFNKVRRGLGLDRCRLFLSGAAPLGRDTMEYFLSLNIPLMELYGMSESTGPHAHCMSGTYRMGTCGRDMSGVETVLLEKDAEGNGEICMRGRHIFMGYLNNEEKTKETLDADGLLRTGDIGKKDEQGFLTITGRIKELLITAGGENIAPVGIEDAVKSELAVVGNCMLIGDRMKFLSILLTLKTEVDAEGVPRDALTKQSVKWLHAVGVTASTVSELRDHQNEAFSAAIQAGIDRANQKAVSRAQKIQKWRLLPRDFSIPGGELGPTMKLKRPVVNKMYADYISNFYSD